MSETIAKILLEERQLQAKNNLKPVKETKFYRRNLPHIEETANFYFVTFRTAQDFALSEIAKDITFSSIKFHADKKYKLHAGVVMETHVHLSLEPLEESKGSFYSLAQIMHSIKSYSANRIQRIMNKKGNIWLDENYDRIIRNDEDYNEKMSYIINNPVKANLVQDPKEYKWLLVNVA